ncbi:MAG TPA: peptide chain release factor N(5)-glutamine methyltransferase [Acidobacteriota bacterium]|nr:peptide chain release factor N(5)-glutamine methyltransferase [Acidobacteriota bacterium]
MKDKFLTLREAIHEGTNYLASHGLETARRDAELLVMNVVGKERAFLYTHPEWPLSDQERIKFCDWLQRRKDRYPIQYLVGFQEFYGRSFKVDPRVLIPRPETELLVDVSLELIAGRRESVHVADIGTGSGCIAVTLACENPLVQVTATDISPGALEIARENAERLGCVERIEFVRGDLLEPLVQSSGRNFDLILSNPPYVDDESTKIDYSVRTFEPPEAVFAGPTGFEIYQKILSGAPAVLHEGGSLVLEIGAGQLEALEELARQRGWGLVESRNDLAGIPRCAVFCRTQTPGG